MKTAALTEIITALNKQKVEYLIAGGLAVVAHGYVRFTADIDIILHMSDENLQKAVAAFKNLGFIPRPPVAIESFAVAEQRESWIKEKNLKVFSLWAKNYPGTEVDLFVNDPVGFENAYKRAAKYEIMPGLEATFLSLEDLIKTKAATGRIKDKDDIDTLIKINKNGKEDEKE